MLAKWILNLAYLSDISVKISKLNGLWSDCEWAKREVDDFHRRAEIVEEGNGRHDCSFLNTKFTSGRWKHWTSWCKKCYHGTFGKMSSWICMQLARGYDGIQLGDSEVKDLTDAISSTTGLQEQCTEIQTTTHCPIIFKNKYDHWIHSGSKEKTTYHFWEMRIWNFYYPCMTSVAAFPIHDHGVKNFPGLYKVKIHLIYQ